MSLYRPLEAAPGTLRFKLFRLGEPVTLSDSLPMLEHMGMQGARRASVPRRAAGPPADLDARLRPAVARSPTPTSRSTRCTRCSRTRSARVFRGEVENDDFNRLVLAARMPAERDRRCCAPTRSTCGRSASRCRRRSSRRRWPRTPTSRACWSSCSSCASIRTRAPARGAKAAEQVRAIEAALEDVENLSEDRVLRQYLALILATTRTNYWRRDADGQRDAASCRSSSIRPRCPACPSRSRCSRSSSTRRASKACTCAAARSRAAACAGPTGRRTSAPRCSGLVKAQMVKNIVIVPVGSKGGFVLKRAPAPTDRDAYHEGRRRLLPGLPARPARHHRQPRRRHDRAAAAA